MQPRVEETNTASRPTGGARPRRLVRSALRIGGVVLLAYVTVAVAAMFLENALIFFPLPYPAGDWNPAGIAFEDAWFSSTDGVRLHGWYVPNKDARAVVLFCHGNGGNLTHRIDALRALHRRVGASVLLFDYRGYGRSEGKPSVAGAMADALAARDWLARRENIAPDQVVLLGESLGGAVAVELAAQGGAKALVLESTFNSLTDVAAWHYPFLPVRWLMRTRLDSALRIGDFRGPLLQAHGDADTIVPLPFGQKLFEAANQPKRFLLLPGHNHNDPMPLEYYDALRDFLDAPRQLRSL